MIKHRKEWEANSKKGFSVAVISVLLTTFSCEPWLTCCWSIDQPWAAGPGQSHDHWGDPTNEGDGTEPVWWDKVFYWTVFWKSSIICKKKEGDNLQRERLILQHSQMCVVLSLGYQVGVSCWSSVVLGLFYVFCVQSQMMMCGTEKGKSS